MYKLVNLAAHRQHYVSYTFEAQIIVFIALQKKMQAERDIVMANPSVCPNTQ